MANLLASSKWHQTFHQSKKIRRHVRKLRREGVQRNIIVSGYPKSGNTWLARMLADFAECNLIGYLSDNQEVLAREAGLAEAAPRNDIVIVKSHHTLPLLRFGGIGKSDIAMIVRDPRDIAVSGSGFFFGKENRPTPEAIDRMIDMMIDNKRPSVRWQDLRWDQFVQQSRDRSIPWTRYEDLITSPKSAMSKILQSLGLSARDAELEKVISFNSFQTIKQRVEQAGKRAHSKHLRSGQSGEYKKYLSPQQQNRIESEFRPLMQDLGYL